MFPAFPDVGNGFPAGSCGSGIRSRINWGAGATGSIFCMVDSDVVARSDDEGATWINLGNPSPGNINRGIAEMSNGRLWALVQGTGTPAWHSDDGGASWTGNAMPGINVNNLRTPIASIDGSRILMPENGGSTFNFTTSLIGVPVLTEVDLTAITGQTAGPGGGARASSFDDTGGCLLVGDFGDLCYTPDFATFELITDADNPLYRGDNVGATTSIGGVWSPAHDGFILASLASGSGVGAFVPRTSVQDLEPISMNTLNGRFDDGMADSAGNIRFNGTTIDNMSYVSLIDATIPA
jgi:hypothetical protein